jgi:hypothetical protein
MPAASFGRDVVESILTTMQLINLHVSQYDEGQVKLTCSVLRSDL